MKNKNLIRLIIFILLGHFGVPVQAYLLPPEYILKNNVHHRRYVRRMAVRQELQFIDGFYSSSSFTCTETIYFRDFKTIRLDYDCNGIPYTVLQLEQKRQIIHNKQIEELDDRSPHFLTSLFLFRDGDELIKSLSYYQFVQADEAELESSDVEGDDELLPTLEPAAAESGAESNDEKKEIKWNVKGKVSLVRLDKIDISTQDKMEKNVLFQLSAPDGSAKRLWFEKNLYLPQKIEYEGKDFIFSNYKEITNNHKKYPRFFRYPQKIEIQEGGISGIIIEFLPDKTEINPKFERNFFDTQTLVENQSTEFESNSTIQRTLEKFVKEFR